MLHQKLESMEITLIRIGFSEQNQHYGSKELNIRSY